VQVDVSKLSGLQTINNVVVILLDQLYGSAANAAWQAVYMYFSSKLRILQ
jgi:hypothetical protein